MQRLRYSKTSDQVSLHTEKAVSSLVLKEKRKTPYDKIMYNGQDLSFFMVQKIEHIVSKIAETEKQPFDLAYKSFLDSLTYKILLNTASMLWAENVEFITDEYYRERRT
jgi:hypothetical protein